MNFAVSPPEINSARIFGGAGPGPLLAAAAAWDVLADELGSAATAFSSVTSGLANASWQGAASAAMVDVAGRYLDWLAATGVLAEQAAGQARMTATAFEATLAASVHPVSVIANRSQMVALVTSNLLGLNAPAIAAVDAEYEQMWAQDVAAMFGYHAEASGVVSALSPFTELLRLPSAAVSAFVVSTQAAIADPPGRVSILAAGLANVGGSNVGAGNVGDANVGFGNRGVWNLGLGSVGSFNLGSGNVGGHNVGW
ncbi:PPE family protein, partial [Mycobacterium paragordonae]